MNKKIICSLLVFSMVTNIIVYGNVDVAKADAKLTKKEEVVYTSLDYNGAEAGVYVVNSFNSGKVVDYGKYDSVSNLSTEDEIKVDNDKITIDSEAKKVFYQGNLGKVNIPWDIDVKYYLDGEEYTGKDLAGRSGKLEITIDITQNKECKDSFWKSYALQGTLVLDGNKCTNIEAENATIANVGSNKQLSYIILPNKGANLSIKTDVKDFEMESMSFNGVKMNLNVEMDSSELEDKVNDLQDAVEQINDGSNSLNDGIKTLQSALLTLNGKSLALTTGSAKIMLALNTINSELGKVSINSKDIKSLSVASNKINKGIQGLVKGLGNIENGIDNYYTQLKKAGISDTSSYIDKHNQLIKALNITTTQRQIYKAYVSSGDVGVINKLKELATGGNSEAVELFTKYQQSGWDGKVISQYVESAGKLIATEQLLQGDIEYIKGSDTLIKGIDSVIDSKNGKLMKGAIDLQNNYKVFNSKIQGMSSSLVKLTNNVNTLKTAINQLTTSYKLQDEGINAYTNAVNEITKGYDKIYKGSNELVDGTSKFYDKTENMDKEISDSIDDAIEDMTGKNIKTISFVSGKNTNIKSVLFVIKTPAIEKQEEVKVEVEEEKEGFLDKLIELFR